MVGRTAVAVLLAASLASSRPAEACHIGTEIGVVLYGVAEVSVNGAFTIHNLVVDESSRGFGIAETVVTTPSLLLGIALARHTFTTCDEGGSDYPVATRGEQTFTIGMVGWTAALLAHGIYTIARPREGRPTATALVPVPVSSERGELLGFGVAGRF